MSIVRLVYISQPTDQFQADDIEKILVSAQANNRAKFVTGMLVFNSNLFLQVLEGGPEQVNGIFSKIFKDPRHRKVQLVNYGPIKKRLFADWSMGYCGDVERIRKQLLKYSQSDSFVNPHQMSPDALLDFLASLRYGSKAPNQLPLAG